MGMEQRDRFERALWDICQPTAAHNLPRQWVLDICTEALGIERIERDEPSEWVPPCDCGEKLGKPVSVKEARAIARRVLSLEGQ